MDELAWHFWIDVGGTFTDCLAQSPSGEIQQTKILSSGIVKGPVGQIGSTWLIAADRKRDGLDFWVDARIRLINASGELIEERIVKTFDDVTCELTWVESVRHSAIEAAVAYELNLGVHAPILSVRRLLKLPLSNPLPDCEMHLGTTRGTNSLLTRRGAKTAFITSKGLSDLLTIGDQARPNLFELTIQKPDPLFNASYELHERILADGTVEFVPNPDEVHQLLTEIKAKGFESIAVCLMHGYRYPDHERLVGQIANEVGFGEVRLSSEVAPLIKIVPRGETTVLDAYLNPVIGRYLDQIEDSLSPDSMLRLMTSSGGLVPRERFSGKDSVLSGPAGGVVGAARIAEQAGYPRMIGFDMGGTSTDVSRYDGQFEKEFETRKAGVRIVSPMLAIETVAAGGGSICRFDGAKLVVGPESASADPGPACYGAGGPLTVTDVNLYLGRIVKDQFPFPLDEAVVETRLNQIGLQMRAAGHEITTDELAIGFLDVANNNMAAAIRSVSVAKGYDPADYLLVSFGGAGSQHCCAVADNLGMRKILYHPQSSILSAVGIRLAEHTASRVRTMICPLDQVDLNRAMQIFGELKSEIRSELQDERSNFGEPDFFCSLDMRYSGTEPFQSVAYPSDGNVSEAFAQVHRQLFGYTQDRPLEIVAARVEGRITGNKLDASPAIHSERTVVAKLHQPILDPASGQNVEAQVFDRTELKPGDQIDQGQTAVVADEFSTVMVDAGWRATTLADGQLLLERIDPTTNSTSVAEDYSVVNPVQLEIFNNHFSSIARQMGISLQMTAVSVNIKERLDFSCAVFTGDGRLVVNAPHIPVHLGAMSQTVKAIIADNPDVTRGDVFVTNDPYRGGSHLPDITVVSPVFVKAGKHPVFWVASRGHHAEIGGKSPGSMPADATCLAEEGVLIQNFKLIDAGNGRFDELRQLLTSGRYPSRTPDENLADLSAQVAANRRGETDLLRLVQQNSLNKVLAYMDHIQTAAECNARKAISSLPDFETTFSDSMDNGATIRVAVHKIDDTLTIDFSGTDPVQPDNLNANSAIVSAAVIYVMRLLITDDIPLNEGVLAPVSIVLPECFLNPTPAPDPANSPAIVGGNVETSQRVVDVLLASLGVAAASCGTMNNWLIGDSNFGYYETVGGGSGATAKGPGASGVHTHMTNTRLTDPEVLETRYPVILRRFGLRSNSGGKGQFDGGEGMIREFEFTKPLTLTLLTSRRTTQPFGLKGGQPAAPGQNILITDATEIELPSKCEVQIVPGQRLRLLTPGGGGFARGPTIKPATRSTKFVV